MLNILHLLHIIFLNKKIEIGVIITLRGREAEARKVKHLIKFSNWMAEQEFKLESLWLQSLYLQTSLYCRYDGDQVQPCLISWWNHLGPDVLWPSQGHKANHLSGLYVKMSKYFGDSVHIIALWRFRISFRCSISQIFTVIIQIIKYQNYISNLCFVSTWILKKLLLDKKSSLK